MRTAISFKSGRRQATGSIVGKLTLEKTQVGMTTWVGRAMAGSGSATGRFPGSEKNGRLFACGHLLNVQVYGPSLKARLRVVT